MRRWHVLRAGLNVSSTSCHREKSRFSKIGISLRTWGHMFTRCTRKAVVPEVISLLARFADYIVESDLQIRENSVSVLTKCSTSLCDSNDLEILCALFSQFVRWIEFETEYIRVFGVACSQAHRLTLRLLGDEKYWQEALKLTAVLHDIGCGRLEKNGDIHGTIVKLQESLAATDTLAQLVKSYLTDSYRKQADCRRNSVNTRAPIDYLSRQSADALKGQECQTAARSTDSRRRRARSFRYSGPAWRKILRGSSSETSSLFSPS